jgi:nucleoside-diphosphate-sugar epimerase
VRVLVTGASGFIGTAVVNFLNRNDHDVLAGVRTTTGLPNKKFTEVELGDLSQFSELDFSDLFEGVDVVVHTAACAHIKKGHSSDELMSINKDATLALAAKSAKANVKRFVFLSSIGVNGNNTIEPFTEECTPCPHDPYSVSKYEAELSLLELATKTKMEVVIIRPTLVYALDAPGSFSGLVNVVRKGVPLPFGCVRNKKSFVALDNIVDFIGLCIDLEKSPRAANEIFLISDGLDVSVPELLKVVAKACNKSIILLPVPIFLMTTIARCLGKSELATKLFGDLQVDSSKARRLLGWQPIVTMEKQLVNGSKESDKVF